MTAMTRQPRQLGRARMRDYVQAVVEGWTEGELLRLHLHELPRSLMDLSNEERNALLSERPPLSGTAWDQLLAATVEHVCELHGLTAPAWSQEPERFRRVPHVFSAGRAMMMQTTAYAPAAFIRHGALADPTSLDVNGHSKFPHPRSSKIPPPLV